MKEAAEKTQLDFLAGGGEMGERIRNFDWSKTPLGNPETWEQSLKTCVRIMLTSSQPIWIGWGKELIKLYNDPYIKIAGGKHPQALGQPAAAVWKEIWNEIEPLLSKVMKKNDGTYAEAQLLIMKRYGYEEETYYTYSYNPVPGDDGGTAGMICYNTDDTAHIINERHLRTLKDLSNNLLNVQTDEEVYIVTLETLKQNPYDFPFAVIYKVSEDRKRLSLAGKTSAHLIKNFPDKIDLEKDADVFHCMAEVIETNKTIVFEDVQKQFGNHLPTGTWQKQPEKLLVIPVAYSKQKSLSSIIEIGVNPYRLLDNKYKDFFQLAADQIGIALSNVHALEEERKHIEALIEIDKAKTTFFNNISHEFRTPLTLILGPLENLLQQSNGELSPHNKESIEATHRNALRLLRLVNTLLEFSRIEAGRMKAHYQPVNLSKLTADLAGNFRSLIEKAGLEFNVHCSKECMAYADAEMWEKIVLNLISNAFKYTLSGKINISLHKENLHAILKVEDTGTGIPEKELPHMFQRFHRIENTGGRTHEGTGIGLSLVHELVQMHGGTITVESMQVPLSFGEGLGVRSGDELGVRSGSTFTVTIPCGKEHLPAEQIFEEEKFNFNPNLSQAFITEASGFGIEKPDEQFAALTDEQKFYTASIDEIKSDKRCRVLVADDNADMRSYIQQLLHDNYHVTLAVNGKDALAKIKQQQPDLILSDIMMPVMDGIQLLKAVKENAATEKIPVMLLSARAGEEAKAEGLEQGADDYLVKPFSAKELISRVRSQIKIAKLRSDAEMQLRNVFMQAPAAIAVLEVPSYKYAIANAAYQTIVHRSEQQLIGKAVREIFPEEEGQGVIEIFNQVAATGKAFTVNEFPLELDVFNDGIKRLHYYSFTTAPLKDASGKIYSLMAVAVDVTEQVKARKKIEESEIRSRLAIEAAELGTFDWNILKPEFIYSKRLANIFGYPHTKNLKQQSFVDVIHPDDLPVRKKAHEEAFKTGALFYKARVIWQDKSLHWVRIDGKIVFDKNVATRMYGTVLDITEQQTYSDKLEKEVEERTRALKEANIQLEKTNRELEQFAHIASHDLQEPLRKIQTFSNMLQSNSSEDAIEKYLKKINSSAGRMQRLIQDVLNYSRTSQLEEQFISTDLNEIIENAKHDFELLIEEKKAVIKYKNLPAVKGIPSQLLQLFSNLISNALKFSNKKPVIQIIAATAADEEIKNHPQLNPQKKYHHIIFKDNGIGFQQEYAEQIFAIFQRLHNNQGYPGTGIGLALVKKIAENHFGAISAYSKTNKGARFDIYLPA